jgi:hypothetical protein
MADEFIGQQLQGELVNSEDKWMIVFPEFSSLKKLFLEAARESVQSTQGIKVVPPLSWSAFPVLKKNGGLHITLRSKPSENVKDLPINVTITGSAAWFENAYRSSLSKVPDQLRYGFFVLLVSIDDNDILKLKCDPPCHITIGQYVNV